MNEQFNRHHISYPRREHKTNTQRLYRGFGVIVANAAAHDELHNILMTPPMPTKYEMIATMMYAEGTQGLFKLEMMAYSFGDLARRAEALDDHAGFVRCKAVERNYMGQLHLLGRAR